MGDPEAERGLVLGAVAGDQRSWRELAALYEVKLVAAKIPGTAVTARLRYILPHPPASDTLREARSLSAAEMAPEFARAPKCLRVDVLVARFASLLGSPGWKGTVWPCSCRKSGPWRGRRRRMPRPPGWRSWSSAPAPWPIACRAEAARPVHP